MWYYTFMLRQFEVALILRDVEGKSDDKQEKGALRE